eukprot:12347588-Ditylum_brightwellii.AAC.1
MSLKIKLPQGQVRNIQEFNTFTNFCIQAAKSLDEVKQLFQTFLFPVQFKAADQANGRHIRVVEQFTQENNLAFKEKKDYNDNSLQNIVTAARNTCLKNKNQNIQSFTGMYINVTRLKGIKENRKPGVWYDYFAE